MLVKFNFEAKSKNFTNIKQRTSNIDALTPDNFEMWAFKNCQSTVSDYLNDEYQDDNLIMNVTYTYNIDNDITNSYQYVIDVANNDCKYYVNDTGVYSYNFTQFIDKNSLFYLDAIAALNNANNDNHDNNESADVEVSKIEDNIVTIGEVLNAIGITEDSDFNPFMLTDILNYFIKNTIGTDVNIAMEDLIGSFETFNDNCRDELNTEPSEDENKLTLVDLLTSKLNNDFENEIKSDENVISLINNELNHKITNGDFNWCMLVNRAGFYCYECNNRKDILLNSNSISVKIESVSSGELTTNVKTAVIKFGKTQGFSNIFFNELPDNTFTVICEFR